MDGKYHSIRICSNRRQIAIAEADSQFQFHDFYRDAALERILLKGLHEMRAKDSS